MASTTMRAWEFTHVPTTLASAIKLNPSAPVLASAATLKPDETLVRIHYASLNPVDFKIVEAPIAARILAFRKPATPAYDFCGTVVATGSSRTDLEQGQWVFGMLDTFSPGALADYAVVKRNSCIAVPEGVRHEDAATIGIAGITAWQCIIPRLPQKDRGAANVFINGGSGGVGSFGIQFAKAKGCFVVTTCSERNVELCKRLGADRVIDYTKHNVVDELAKIARENGGFDLAVNNVDIGGDVYWKAQRYLKVSAPYVTIAAAPSLASVLELFKALLIPASLGGGQRKFELVGADPKPSQYAEIAQLIKDGQVKPVIEQIYDMEEAPRAYERLKTGRVSGKLVVKVA